MIGWKDFANLRVFSKLRFKFGAVIVAEKKDGTTVSIDPTEIAALASLAAGDIEKIEGITNGTVSASKAVVVDANKDTTGLRNVTYTGNLKESVTDAITAFATGGQASAVALTADINTVTICATAGDSVKLPVAAPGLAIEVMNLGAASLNVFPATGDLINALAINAAFAVLPGRSVVFRSSVLLKWKADPDVGIPQEQFVSIASGNGTLTGANIAGAKDCFLLTSGATALTTPTAANILAAIPNGYVGQSYRLRVVNTNGGTLTLTMDASVTATGTLTLATNTWRDFVVTLTGLTTATMKQVGTGTNS